MNIMTHVYSFWGLLTILSAFTFVPGLPAAQALQKPELSKELRRNPTEVFPPALPDGQRIVTHTSPEFLKPPSTLRAGVSIAATPPKIDFMFFPGQNYPGKPWSAWGDSFAVNGKYYASIGDHLAPEGNSFVYEYDPTSQTLRQLVDVRKILSLPGGYYTPGKIHGRLDLGEDGWLYFSTHRGSTKVTTDEFHYLGDWIIRHHVPSGRNEIVARGPAGKHCIPASVVDPKRMIFYGGTAPGKDSDPEGIKFFAYDLQSRKLLYSGSNGPSRYLILANSTGRVYWNGGKEDGPLMRYDPAIGKPEQIPGTIGIRSATQATAQGMVYTVSNGQGDNRAELYAFDTKSETVRNLGSAAVGTQNYITSIDVDPSGRFLYYVPGAHGGSELDGCPVVQFNIRTGQKKVLAFLHPFFANKYGCTLKGTFSSAIDPSGERLYVTWNNSRGAKAWDSAVLTVVHIPPAERPE